MVFNYASTNVHTNAVRAIHQLVECVANANPTKTMAKFFFFLLRQTSRSSSKTVASSLRTTSASCPLPSDATLHWNLAILRGAVYKSVCLSLRSQSRVRLTVLCRNSDGRAVRLLFPICASSTTYDAPQALKYKDELISLLRLLRDQTFSKRGYSWTGKLLSSLLLTLTHTYPLENKFVNPEEWDSQGQHSSVVLSAPT